jgi:hypothetical protein
MSDGDRSGHASDPDTARLPEILVFRYVSSVQYRGALRVSQRALSCSVVIPLTNEENNSSVRRLIGACPP